MKVSIAYQRRKKVGINPKTFIDFSQTIDDVYEKKKTIIQQRKERC